MSEMSRTEHLRCADKENGISVRRISRLCFHYGYGAVQCGSPHVKAAEVSEFEGASLFEGEV
ncbi:MAG: hypothetical protein IJ080_05740, partial [Oscillospiraceae bacterium]|nr:hypothetical protein [Oscillospiraceae bacterium]